MFFTASWAGRHFCDDLRSTYLRGFTCNRARCYFDITIQRLRHSPKWNKTSNNKRNGALFYCLDPKLLLRLPASQICVPGSTTPKSTTNRGMVGLHRTTDLQKTNTRRRSRICGMVVQPDNNRPIPNSLCLVEKDEWWKF